MRATARRALAALGAALLTACGGDGGADRLAIQNTSDVAGGVVTNAVISVPVSIEGSMAQPFVLDTGSILTRLDPGRFADLGIVAGLDRAATLDVGTLHLTNVDFVAASLCGVMMMCRGSEPAGLLGGELLLPYRVTIDYRAGTVTFGELTTPADVGPPTTASFALEGGGEGNVDGAAISLPATRISLDLDVEGTPMRMVLDTGSSTLILRPDVYDDIVSDGRAQTSIDVATVLGMQTAPLTLVHTVTVGSTKQAEIEAVRAPLDIEALEQEVGHRVDGLLGGSFLAAYVTTIDYPNRTLTLRPYIQPLTTAQ